MFIPLSLYFASRYGAIFIGILKENGWREDMVGDSDYIARLMVELTSKNQRITAQEVEISRLKQQRDEQYFEWHKQYNKVKELVAQLQNENELLINDVCEMANLATVYNESLQKIYKRNVGAIQIKSNVSD